MGNFKDKLVYLFPMGLFVILKFWYTKSSNSDVLFLLKPTNELVNLATSSSSVFESEIGFFNQNLNIIINKSCSGFNFWMMVFLMLSFLLIKFFKENKFRILAIFGALVLSYFFTIFVNVSRILFSIFMKNFVINKYSWIHQTEGTFVYLSFLIVMYLIADYFLKKMKNEEFA